MPNLAQIVARHFTILAHKYQRLKWDFTVSFAFFFSQIEPLMPNLNFKQAIFLTCFMNWLIPHSLDFCIFKRFWIATAPGTHKVFSNWRVKVNCQILILEVTFLCRFLKLSVIKTIILSWQIFVNNKAKVSGAPGDRTLGLPHAKRTLYHWARTPVFVWT